MINKILYKNMNYSILYYEYKTCFINIEIKNKYNE